MVLFTHPFEVYKVHVLDIFLRMKKTFARCYISYRRRKTKGLSKKPLLHAPQLLNCWMKFSKRNPGRSVSPGGLQLFSTGTSLALRTGWNSCVVEAYSFTLQPMSAFLMWTFVTAGTSSRSDVLDIIDMPVVPHRWISS